MNLTETAASVYRAAAAPLGRVALARAVRAGLPAVSVPALRYLFGEPLDRHETRAAADVEAMRNEIARSPVRFHVLDTTQHVIERSGVEIAQRSSVSPIWGAVLMRLARASNAQTILELGSCAGISTAYLASAGASRVVGVEGSADLAPLANSHAQRVSPGATVRHARFDDVLDGLAETVGAPDLVFIDGEHTRRARLHYFARVRPHLAGGAVVIFDDVHLSGELWSAWREVQRAPGVGASITLGRFGVCLIGATSAPVPPNYEFSRYSGWLRVGGRWRAASE